MKERDRQRVSEKKLKVRAETEAFFVPALIKAHNDPLLTLSFLFLHTNYILHTQSQPLKHKQIVYLYLLLQSFTMSYCPFYRLSKIVYPILMFYL